jgi:hypothetical protein
MASADVQPSCSAVFALVTGSRLSQTSAALSASCERAPALRPSQSLALTIGVNITVFSHFNQMIFVRLGVPHLEELRVFRLTGDDRVVIRGISGTTGR